MLSLAPLRTLLAYDQSGQGIRWKMRVDDFCVKKIDQWKAVISMLSSPYNSVSNNVFTN